MKLLERDDIPENHILYWRKKRNMSLQNISNRLMFTNENAASAKTINRWERHELPVPEWAITEIAKILKISERELMYGPTDGQRETPVNISASYTGLDLEIAENVINMGFTSWIASKPDEARRAVEGIMPFLENAQRRAPISSLAKQGKHIQARGYELLGALALDQLQNDIAIAQFRRALSISEELGDNNLIAAHMTELGDASRRNGNNDTALALMSSALEKARKGQRSTHGYVLEMLAYTHADNGNEVEFQRHIEEAIDLLGHSGEGEGAGKRDFIPFEVLEIYGKVMRDFGHPTKALSYFDQAEQALMSRPNVPRWHAVLTISKAQALCDAGQLEEGVKLAIRGIILAHNCQSPRQMNRVRKLMRKLDNTEYKATPALMPLREVVSDIYIGNRNPLDWHPRHAM